MAIELYTSKRSGLQYYSGTERFDSEKRDHNGLVIANILINLGWSVNAVAGILGNMQSESGCNPGAYFGYAEYSETSFGLVQWDPTSKYEEWADANGYSPYYDIEYQCERIQYEFENGIQYYSTDEYPISRTEFVTSDLSPYELACAFAWNYERSAVVLWGTDEEKQALKEQRGSQATQWLEKIGDSGFSQNAKIITDAITWAVSIANDDTHGYDQQYRWGPDYDCSSLLIQAFENAGLQVKAAGAYTTRNIIPAFIKCGFVQLDYSEDLKRGDVLWRYGHVGMYIGDGNIVSAHVNELGGATGGQTGDQTGREIDVSPLSKSGKWTYILRLPSFGEYIPPISTKKKGLSKLLLYSAAIDLI